LRVAAGRGQRRHPDQRRGGDPRGGGAPARAPERSGERLAAESRRAGELLGAGFGPQPRRPGLLAGAVVAVQRARLDRLVDRADELGVLGGGALLVALVEGSAKPAEVGPDARDPAAVLVPLALGALVALLLRMDVGHRRAPTIPRRCPAAGASPATLRS